MQVWLVAGSILVLLSIGVFLWAVVGLINPAWARLPHRKMSVAVWALSAVLAVAGVSLLPSDDSTEGTESGVGVSAPASNQATESESNPAAGAPAERPPSRDAQAQANFDAALAGKPLPFPLFAETFKAEIAAEKEAAPPSSPPAPRPRALTAQAFASRLTWNDMEPIGIFAGRMPGRRIRRTSRTDRGHAEVSVRLPGRWSDHRACTSVRTRTRPVCLGRRC